MSFSPFAFAVLDTVALLGVLALIVRGLLRAILGRPAWGTVLIATTSYALWVNALLVFGLTAFNPGTYLVILTDVGWEAIKGAPASAETLLAHGPLRLLLVSWLGVSVIPTLAVAAIQCAAQRRVW